MVLTFINKDDNPRLILIFTGWSTDDSLYRNFRIEGWDVAVAHSYSDLSLDVSILNQYYTIYIFAWSLGVFIADTVLPANRITAAFAINGTVNPASDKYGIPESIFRGTAVGLSISNLQKFRKRMMPDAETYRHTFPESPTNNDIEILKQELYAILDMNFNAPGKPRLPWSRAYISEGDRIFPPQNMVNAWQLDSQVDIKQLNGAHFIDIPVLIRSIIADTQQVSKRFSKAAITYDLYACAQQLIACHLSYLIKPYYSVEVKRLLEIGPGTGALTKCYAEFIKPDYADFVDITPTGPFNIANNERYEVKDAEIWINDTEDIYNLIISSSAIQWFADLPRFVMNCNRIMASDGLLAFSTFLPGNLYELDELRPAPLLYQPEDKIKSALLPYFEILNFESSTITVKFHSYRDLLMHLKHTGVAGSAISETSPFTLSKCKSLTYKPLYVVARKR